MTAELLMPPPLLTADLPGTGGRLKSTPADFEVEEIPAYQPSGSGDFLYLWVEKTGMGAEYFLRQVARRLGISNQEVGTAGLKDRHAVTRQMVSVPKNVEERLPQLDGDGIRVLSISRHSNKLKSGHLRGNRFRILIRDVVTTTPLEELVAAIVRRLREHGLPNFYGPQRFGHDGETARIGLVLLRGQPIPESTSGRRHNPKSPFLRKLAVSAAQSVLFNCYLACRLNDGLLRRVLPGDVMSKWPAGGLFVAEDMEREQLRFDTRETVTTGPIFGRKTFPAQAEAAEREKAILQELKLTKEAFHAFGKLMQGTRRHNLVYLDDVTYIFEPEGLRLSFSLPAGCYATVLLREVMKTESADSDDETA